MSRIHAVEDRQGSGRCDVELRFRHKVGNSRLRLLAPSLEEMVPTIRHRMVEAGIELKALLFYIET